MVTFWVLAVLVALRDNIYVLQNFLKFLLNCFLSRVISIAFKLNSNALLKVKSI